MKTLLTTGYAFLVGFYVFFAQLNAVSADTKAASNLDHIRAQLDILERAPENLSPEQRRSIQNIRQLIDERPEQIAPTSSRSFEPCKRGMINNEDGTFTFVLQTDREIQHWLLPVNSNEFNRGMNWHDARKRAKEYDLNGVQGWNLPPAAVLHGIHRVNSNCPGAFANATGNSIVHGQFYHFAYWTSNEYSYVNAREKYHADAVSLYTGNVIHERKENIGMLWPAKLISKEPIKTKRN
jgi:hypothetical protein